MKNGHIERELQRSDNTKNNGGIEMSKLSVKCTPENRANIGCDINKDKCIYCTKNSYCGDFDNMIHDEILNVFDRLGQLEDAAEQREKGCEYCNEICAKCYWYDEDGRCVFSNVDCSDGAHEYDTNNRYERDPKKRYCPRCGRKLV